jgi:hypothetical protein
MKHTVAIVGVAILVAVPLQALPAERPVIAVSSGLQAGGVGGGQQPAHPVTLEAGDLRLGLQSTSDGIRLVSLLDSGANRNLREALPALYRSFFTA